MCNATRAFSTCSPRRLHSAQRSGTYGSATTPTQPLNGHCTSALSSPSPICDDCCNVSTVFQCAETCCIVCCNVVLVATARTEFATGRTVLQHVVLCCNTLHSISTCCLALKCGAMCCNVVQCAATHCTALQRDILLCNEQHYIATCVLSCNVLQCVALLYPCTPEGFSLPCPLPSGMTRGRAETSRATRATPSHQIAPARHTH